MRLATLFITVLAAVGCVERTITITSQPSGALVYLNDEEVGRTPTTVRFTWYGVYDVRLSKAGYQTLSAAQEAKAPLGDTLGIDFFAEVLPIESKVNLDWHFELRPLEPVEEELLVDRANQMRALLEAETGEGAPTEPAAPEENAPAASAE